MLYMMSVEKVSFTDDVSGFYNIDYLKWLADQVKSGEYKPHLVIRYSLPDGNDMTEFFDQLREMLPEQCDTVKMNDTSYVTIIYGNTRGLINMLSEDIEMIAESLNLDIKYEYVIKEKGQTPAEFFEKNVVIGG